MECECLPDDMPVDNLLWAASGSVRGKLPLPERVCEVPLDGMFELEFESVSVLLPKEGL